MDSFFNRIQNKFKKGVSKGQNNLQKETFQSVHKIYINETHLPENFAIQVQELEQTIESGDGTIQDLNHLIFLFKSAIEYYQERHNDKYFYFNYKLKSIWNKHTVKNIIDVSQMNKENNTKQIDNDRKQKVKNDRQQQIMEHQHNINRISSSISKEQIDKLIVQKHNDLQSQNDIKQSQIREQRNNIFKKIVKRNQQILVDGSLNSQKSNQLVQSLIQL